MKKSFKTEVLAGERFQFGENWWRFLEILDDNRIMLAEQSLCKMLAVKTLTGKRFLDVGSGSGLFSLAARRLGATVHSFDYDPKSVACTRELKNRYFPKDETWVIEKASALDKDYLSKLGQFDVIYSWGVLHHTGAMWEALGNVAPLVKMEGVLFIAIYNDQGHPSKVWKKVKELYCTSPEPLRTGILLLAFLRLWGPTMARDLLTKGNPLASWRNYGNGRGRGMSPWRDVVDWVGGYPFEVAKPDDIFNFYRDKGFQLNALTTCTGGGLGCNEFVLSKTN